MLALAAPVPIAGLSLFEIRSLRCPSAPGSLFTLTRHPLAQTNDLVLAHVNNQFLVGRWFPGVAGFDWLVQPSRLIRCAREPVILGRLHLWTPYAL